MMEAKRIPLQDGYTSWEILLDLPNFEELLQHPSFRKIVFRKLKKEGLLPPFNEEKKND